MAATLLPAAGGRDFVQRFAALTGAEVVANAESPRAAAAGGELDSESKTAAVRHELVILDSGVQNFAALRDQLLAQQDAGQDLELFVLDADRDGVAQIAEILARYDDLDAVHVLSHGTAQGLQLGNTWLDGQTINGYAETIRGWQVAFGGNADLLLYGCDLASSDAGRSLVDTLGQWTGTDVAASTDRPAAPCSAATGIWNTATAVSNAGRGQHRPSTGLVRADGVAVDAISTGATTGTSVSVAHTTSSGSNRLMLVGISMARLADHCQLGDLWRA